MLISNFLNSREQAIGAWFAVFVVMICITASRSVGGLIKATLRLYQPFSLFSIYVLLAIAVWHCIGLWDWSQLKTTLIWAAFSAVGSVGRMISTEEHPRLLRGWLKDTASATIIVELIVNSHTFSFWIEFFVLLPLFALIGGMIAVADKDPKHRDVVIFLQRVVGVVGLFLVCRGIWLIIDNWPTFATLATLRDTYTAPLLSLSLLPFLFIIYLYARYETVFLALPIWIPNNRLRDYAKTEAIIKFNVRVPLLRRWQREVARNRPETRLQVVETIKAVIAGEARERNPPHVPESDGWCPILAGNFLVEEGFANGDYHEIDGGEWFAHAPMKQITEGVWSHNMAYYLNGDKDAVRELRLKLYVNGTANRASARATFVRIASRLLERALSSNAVDEPRRLLEAGAPFEIRADTIVRLTRENFPNKKVSGYELVLELKRPGVPKRNDQS